MRDCPACGAEETVEYAYLAKPDLPEGRIARRFWPEPDCFECEECGARFEIDADADFNGERFVDCSTPGKRIG